MSQSAGLTNNAVAPRVMKRNDPVHIDDTYDIKIDDYFVPAHYKDTLQYLMITHGSILDRIEKLAYDIQRDYQGNTVHLMCVLKGGSTFFHDLCTAFRRFHDYGHQNYVPFTFDFVRVKSYEGTESSGQVKITGCDMTKVKGKHVLFVEDIIDTGTTMSKLLAYMHSEVSPASVKVASLLEKRTSRSCGFKADYVGFSIPDKFVVGYCLDYNEAYRDLHHIGVINQEGIQRFEHFED